MAYVCPYRHDGVELHPPGLGDLCAAALGLPHPDRAAVPITLDHRCVPGSFGHWS